MLECAVLSDIHNKVRKTPWLGRAVLKSIPDMKWKISVAPIGAMAIRLRQHRMYWLRPPLTHEGFLLGALQRLVRRGDVAYDIGANIGLYSRMMAQCFGASRVYAFEPMENNRTILAENLKLGGCASRVEIIPFALGHEDGVSDFQVDDITSGSGTLDAVAGENPLNHEPSMACLHAPFACLSGVLTRYWNRRNALSPM